jgi:heat shock protein HtpX
MPELHKVVRELAARADLASVPQLHYVQSQMLNAFAVGKPEDSAIAVTDGLLRAMTMRQIAGILAHEMSHIRNGDLKVMGLADVLNRITSFMSTMGLIGIPTMLGTGWNIPIIGLLLLIFAPTIGGLLQMALSRAREYDADLDGAALTGDPEGLASALATLEHRQRGQWEGLILPGSRLPEPSLLRTHPKTEDRIARLMALRHDRAQPAIVMPDRSLPDHSIVPPIRGPRIHYRMDLVLGFATLPRFHLGATGKPLQSIAQASFNKRLPCRRKPDRPRRFRVASQRGAAAGWRWPTGDSHGGWGRGSTMMVHMTGRATPTRMVRSRRARSTPTAPPGAAS